MTGEQYRENSKLAPTRRHALKLAAGAATPVTLGTTPATAQKKDRQQWVFEAEDNIFSSPTVVGGTVFVGSGDGNLYAADAATGE